MLDTRGEGRGKTVARMTADARALSYISDEKEGRRWIADHNHSGCAEPEFTNTLLQTWRMVRRID